MRLLLAFLVAVGLAHAAPAPLTWSAADHSPQVSASGAVATRSSLASGAWQACRSETAQSVGVRTVTFNIVSVGSSEGTGPGMAVGVGNGKSPTNNYSGTDNNGVSYFSTGRALKNAAYTSPPAGQPPAFTTGDTVGMVVDLNAHTVKFNKNGGAYSTPTDITSLGSDVYVMCALGNGSSNSTVEIATDDWNDFPWTTLNIVAHGDSITLTGGVLQTYVPRLVNLIAANRVGWAQGSHLGINGASWDFAWSLAGYPYTLTQDAPLRVDTARSSALPNWLVPFAGTNDFALAHRTPTTVYNHLKTYIEARLAAGWEADHIIVPTMLPRQGVDETVRQAYIALQVGGASTYGYKLARLDLDPTIGQAGQNTDPAKYLDGTHPTDASHQVIASIIYAVMFP